MLNNQPAAVTGFRPFLVGEREIFEFGDLLQYRGGGLRKGWEAEERGRDSGGSTKALALARALLSFQLILRA